MATAAEQARINRAIPVKCVRYDEGTGVLGFLPAKGLGSAGPARGPYIIKIDDGTTYEAVRAGDGFYEATVDGWSKYGMCGN